MKSFLLVIIFPLLTVLLLSLILAFMGHITAAQALGGPGTLVVLLLAFAYIVFFDSRGAWKGANWITRIINILSYTRSEK